jgi:hypothetical protein
MDYLLIPKDSSHLLHFLVPVVQVGLYGRLLPLFAGEVCFFGLLKQSVKHKDSERSEEKSSP